MEATSKPQKVPVYIEEEMRESFMDYAMSVIISRALPDVRDGLKPVHRRVLYAMYDASNTSDKPYKKSARLVGDIMGKYHPHGDTAIYDTIVRMAQDFNLRYPLVDGQGNFGSIDGDNPAAMRYTEIRMTPLAEEMLADIEKETVDFIPNYDDSLKEPAVLPSRIPNLLINGSAGIAVGMATNIPPHNLSEVIDGLIALDRKSRYHDQAIDAAYSRAGFSHRADSFTAKSRSCRLTTKAKASCRCAARPSPRPSSARAKNRSSSAKSPTWSIKSG